ncbi:MAG: phosphonopyruvate decarboxylase [Oscillospiraceae bacterium]|nr:phosphonopyruvate decarboxylase [Oscillospiraceae bacterium]
MNTQRFVTALTELGADFYTGVPDSLLSSFCDYIYQEFGVSKKHIVAANEGSAVGLAAGHYLATSKPAVVYMQNSGLGNAVNPICSLLHRKVYAIPAIFVIGWRGEPGVKDEPQHLFQGEITLQLLDCLEIPYAVISKGTDLAQQYISKFKGCIENGQSVAFVIRKDALKSDSKAKYPSSAEMSREQVLNLIIDNSNESDIFVCTTGKLSREIFEIREQRKAGHERDFLTVGSMGHSISIAHGMALSKPEIRIFCLDGDGAAIMHLGSLAVAGTDAPENLVHIVINNGAHETVGGMPVVSTHLNLSEVAAALKYRHSFRAADQSSLSELLGAVKGLGGPIFIEVMCSLASRGDLGRPTTTPIQNKNDFMKFVGGKL